MNMATLAFLYMLPETPGKRRTDMSLSIPSETRGAGPGRVAGRGLVIRAATVAALGGLLFGFDTAVISGTTDALQKVFGLDSFWLGFTVAVALIGTIVGSFAVGKPTDVFGRKKVLFAIAV